MTSSLPLIRLSAINPFLLELRRRGVGAESLLRELSLPQDIPASHDLFVNSNTIYEFVERAAELASDRHLGFGIGSELELYDWDPITLAARQANTVGELLTLFTVHASEHTSATRFFLRTDGERSTFGFERVNSPPFRPGQNDAFYVGFMSRMLIRATRDHWDATEVLFRVADPKCIPTLGETFRIAQGDESGARITFPSRWLFEQFQRSHFHSEAKNNSTGEMPRSLLESVRSALRPHLHEPDLTIESAAKICGYNRRRLSRELREAGTTLSKEIAKLRAAKAVQHLAGTNRRVADIAQTVGFTDATVFSRAFKNWTGQSPQQYRRTHKSPS
jgi:AraC-like DNA-binding protein